MKKALIIEPNKHHGEIIPGVVKYFQDLGVATDVIARDLQEPLKPFIGVDSVNFTDLQNIRHLLKESVASTYDYLFFTSYHMYERNIVSHKQWGSIFDNFKNIIPSRNGIMAMCHHLDLLEEEDYKRVKLFSLHQYNNYNITPLNTHYFGEFDLKLKNNNFVNFITVGCIENNRRNTNVLIEAVKKLKEKNINNFQITVIGYRGKLEVPDDLKHYFRLLGKVDFPTMFKEVNSSDYILTLFDPENIEHDRYLTLGTSGTIQLIYGLKKPCLIPQKFAEKYNFDDKNSFIYDCNEQLSKTMLRAICEGVISQHTKVLNLEDLSKSVYEKSLKNLKAVL